MLTTEQVNSIAIEETLGIVSLETDSDEASEFRAKLKQDLKKIRANGYEVQLPNGVGQDAGQAAAESLANCGTGAGGFQPGNDCAAGDGGTYRTYTNVAIDDLPWSGALPVPADWRRLSSGTRLSKPIVVDASAIKPTESYVDQEQVESLKAHIANLENDLPPIIVEENADGTLDLIDGHHRYAAAVELGYTKIPVRLAVDGSVGESSERWATYP